MRKVIILVVIVAALLTGGVALLAPAPAEAKPRCGECEESTWWDYPGACNYQYRDCISCTVCG